jgi:hypothetical protein
MMSPLWKGSFSFVGRLDGEEAMAFSNPTQPTMFGLTLLFGSKRLPILF